jgi:hypothetical protein
LRPKVFLFILHQTYERGKPFRPRRKELFEGKKTIQAIRIR